MSASEPDLKPKERRKGADWLMLLLAMLNLGAWFLLIMGLVLAHLAKPEFLNLTEGWCSTGAFRLNRNGTKHLW